jgi:cytochrome c oxidase subunit 2
MQGWLNFPRAAAAHAADIDRMTAIMHWVMAILFVGWGAFLAYTLVRFHKSRSPKADYHGVRSHLSSYAEAGIVVIEAVLLLFFAVPLWADRVNDFPVESESTIVRVTAEQFAWNIHYPGGDRQFGRRDPSLVTPDNPLGLDRNDPLAKDDVTTINQLNLPVGRPVIVHLSSKDVIHSFGIPEMRVKQDAVPGMTPEAIFVPTREGSFEIACAELCGLAHYRMRGFFNVVSQQAFESWLRDQGAP